MREILELAGMGCDIVDNGIDAVRLACAACENAAGYDLILMDLEMPGMDGIDAAREIRKSGPAAIPIIALTAHAMQHDRERCLAAGINWHPDQAGQPDRLLQEMARAGSARPRHHGQRASRRRKRRYCRRQPGSMASQRRR